MIDGPRKRPITDGLTDAILALPFDRPMRLAEIGQAVGKDATDAAEKKQLQRALGGLIALGELEKPAGERTYVKVQS